MFSENVPFEEERCLECHETGMRLGFKEISRVDPKDLEESSHAGLHCTDCHSGIQVLPHEGAPGSVDCNDCHKVESREYSDSIHGTASIERGEAEASACVDCHGKHRILSPRDPTSTVYRAQIPRTCAKGPENLSVVEKYNIKARGSGAFYSVRQLFNWTLLGRAGLSVIWLIADIPRRFQEGRRHS